MTSYPARIAAVVVAAGLIATAAIPAYADLGPTTAPVQTAADVQSVSFISTSALNATARDGYTVTAPVVVAAVRRVAAPAVAAPSRYSAVSATAPAQTYSGAAVLAYASQFVGVVPYGWGNSPSTSFSCDGFTQYVMAGFGISLPRGADSQARLGVQISKASAVAGDLVYWPGHHIGIYDGAGGMYNSPRPGRFVEHVATLWGDPEFIRLTV